MRKSEHPITPCVRLQPLHAENPDKRQFLIFIGIGMYKKL